MLNIRLEDLPTFFSAFCGSGPGSPDSVMSASSGLVSESSCTTVDEEDPPSELDGGLKKLVIGFCQAGVSLGQYGFPPEYFFSKKNNFSLLSRLYGRCLIETIQVIY